MNRQSLSIYYAFPVLTPSYQSDQAKRKGGPCGPPFLFVTVQERSLKGFTEAGYQLVVIGAEAIKTVHRLCLQEVAEIVLF